MKIFINAATLRVGGGKSVTVNFLKAFDKIIPNDVQVTCIVPQVDEYLKLNLSNISLQFVPLFLNKVYSRFLLDRWIVRKVVNQSPDIIFSMGNIALPVSGIPQIVLFHVPYPIYPESIAWKRLGIKEFIYFKTMKYLFAKRLKYASHVFVQTLTAEHRLKSLYPINSCSVIPNGVSLPINNYKPVKDYPIDPLRINLFCLCHYYPNKNLEILIEVGKLIKERNLNISIVTTISEKQGRGAKNLLEAIIKLNLSNIIINVGPLSMSEVQNVYMKTDGLILPTLLESFSQTYIESMFYKKPVFTSNIDFAFDVCRNYAYYFDPLDANSILETIENAFFEKLEMSAKIDNAFEYVKCMPDWNTIAQSIFKELKVQSND